MKALLLHPIVPFRVLWGKFHRGGGFIPPIGLMFIASYARQKGYDIRILDTGVDSMDEAGLEAYLKEGKYDVVGIPCFTNTARYTFDTARVVRKALPGALIVIGGVHATVLPEKTLLECPEADIIVVGEGEVTFSEILNWEYGNKGALSQIDGIVYREGPVLNKTRSRLPAENLSSFPVPAYDMLKMEKYIPHPTQYKRLPSFPIITSRGCPFSCTFCSASKVHGKKLRVRSLDNVFEEIDLLVGRYGAKGLYIQDSSFTNSRKYVIDFCNRLLDKGYNLSWMANARVDQVDKELVRLMKSAGCWQITIGAESANEASLRLIKKHQDKDQIVRAVETIRKANIQIMACYILGLPGESAREVENTINFAKALATHTALFFLPVPYPGTELLEQCRSDGGLRLDAVWDDYNSTDFSRPIYVNPLLGKERQLKYYNIAHRSFYSSPRVILNNVLGIRSFEDMRRCWRAFSALLGLAN